MPPELPAAKDNTRTPKRSSLCLTPASRAAEREDEGAGKIEATRSVLIRLLDLTTI